MEFEDHSIHTHRHQHHQQPSLLSPVLNNDLLLSLLENLDFSSALRLLCAEPVAFRLVFCNPEPGRQERWRAWLELMRYGSFFWACFFPGTKYWQRRIEMHSSLPPWAVCEQPLLSDLSRLIAALQTEISSQKERAEITGAAATASPTPLQKLLDRFSDRLSETVLSAGRQCSSAAGVFSLSKRRQPFSCFAVGSLLPLYKFCYQLIEFVLGTASTALDVWFNREEWQNSIKVQPLFAFGGLHTSFVTLAAILEDRIKAEDWLTPLGALAFGDSLIPIYGTAYGESLYGHGTSFHRIEGFCRIVQAAVMDDNWQSNAANATNAAKAANDDFYSFPELPPDINVSQRLLLQALKISIRSGCFGGFCRLLSHPRVAEIRGNGPRLLSLGSVAIWHKHLVAFMIRCNRFDMLRHFLAMQSAESALALFSDLYDINVSFLHSNLAPLSQCDDLEKLFASNVPANDAKTMFTVQRVLDRAVCTWQVLLEVIERAEAERKTDGNGSSSSTNEKKSLVSKAEYLRFYYQNLLGMIWRTFSTSHVRCSGFCARVHRGGQVWRSFFHQNHRYDLDANQTEEGLLGDGAAPEQFSLRNLLDQCHQTDPVIMEGLLRRACEIRIEMYCEQAVFVSGAIMELSQRLAVPAGFEGNGFSLLLSCMDEERKHLWYLLYFGQCRVFFELAIYMVYADCLPFFQQLFSTPPPPLLPPCGFIPRVRMMLELYLYAAEMRKSRITHWMREDPVARSMLVESLRLHLSSDLPPACSPAIVLYDRAANVPYRFVGATIKTYLERRCPELLAMMI
jgi:hypothetical protein